MDTTLHMGETTLISLEVRDENDALKDAETSVKITIECNGTEIVAATDMEHDSTGKYHYDFTSVAGTHSIDKYDVTCVVTDGARIAKVKGQFGLF